MLRILSLMITIIIFTNSSNLVTAQNINNELGEKDNINTPIAQVDFIKSFPLRHTTLIYLEYVSNMQTFNDSQLIKMEKLFNLLQCEFVETENAINCSSNGKLNEQLPTYNTAFYSYIIGNDQILQRYISLGLTEFELKKFFELAAIGKAAIKNLIKNNKMPNKVNFNERAYIDTLTSRHAHEANNFILSQLIALGII